MLTTKCRDNSLVDDTRRLELENSCEENKEQEQDRALDSHELSNKTNCTYCSGFVGAKEV